MTTTTGELEPVARAEPFFPGKAPVQLLSGDEGLLSSGDFEHSSLEQDFSKICSWLGKTHLGSLEVRSISTGDHEKLKQRLISQGLRLRYDWDPETQTLALFMPHYIHEAPGEWLCLQTGWLQRELRLVSLCGRPTLSSGGAGASTLINGKHTEPDKSILVHYEFDGSDGSSKDVRRVHIPYPRVVLETAYSQSLPEAKAKLRNHLLLSEGHTHVGILCNMKHPVTLSKNFWATIELWTRDVDEEDTEAQVPHEILDFPHEARPSQGSQTGSDTPDTGEGSVGSSSSASTAIGTDPDATLGDETETVTWPATGEKIRRRWGPVTLIKEDGNSKGGTTSEPSLGDFLPLNVYDFLRVCPMHDEPELWMPPNELLLPLDDLRVTIMNAVVRERERMRRSAAESSTSALSQSPRPHAPPDLPEGTRKRGNPLKEKKGSKRPKF